MEKYNEFIKKIRMIIPERDILLEEPMRNHTSFRIGGNADILLFPHSGNQIAEIIKISKIDDVQVFLMGNGSNLIVKDKGIRGVVIKTHEYLKNIEVDDINIYCEAGVLLSKLANVALEHELTGLEFASGIPGTLGGAVMMNAGAYDGEMANVIVETDYIDEDGNQRTTKGDAHNFGYRTSMFQGTNKIIIGSKLSLKHGEKSLIKNKMDDFNKRRRDKQPLEFPSAGSVFKRPEGYYAGKLIQDCGLGGYRIGGAQVSDKHCGFIINKGNATAEDVINLIKYIQKTVKDKFGVELHTEVRIIGED